MLYCVAALARHMMTTRILYCVGALARQFGALARHDPALNASVRVRASSVRMRAMTVHDVYASGRVRAMTVRICYCLGALARQFGALARHDQAFDAFQLILPVQISITLAALWYR